MIVGIALLISTALGLTIKGTIKGSECFNRQRGFFQRSEKTLEGEFPCDIAVMDGEDILFFSRV